MTKTLKWIAIGVLALIGVAWLFNMPEEKQRWVAAAMFFVWGVYAILKHIDAHFERLNVAIELMNERLKSIEGTPTFGYGGIDALEEMAADYQRRQREAEL